MAAERVARLEALSGWAWDVLEAMWEEGFAHLERYVEAHGDALVPARFKTEDGYRLGNWVGNQRNSRKRGTLAPERVARLEALGVVWEPYEAAWGKSFARLERYIAKHGDARVPDRFEAEDGYNLGGWVSSQRGAHRRSNTLAAERVARLESLSGWAWDGMAAAAEAAWEEGFAHLEQYVEQHGHALVPAAFTTEDGTKLGQWIHVQRRTRVTLVGERVARLEALSGWAWEMRRGPKPSR